MTAPMPTKAAPAVPASRPAATAARQGGRDGRGDGGSDGRRPVLLAVQNLWKIYARHHRRIDVRDPEAVARAESQGAVVAVRDATLRVRRGEIFVVMGLSGSG